MSASENQKTCRLCAKTTEDMGDNFNDLFDQSNKTFLQQIKELTGLSLKNSPKKKLPRYYCKKCKEELPRACDFRRLIIESQDFFKTKNYKNSKDVQQEHSTAQTFDTVFLTYSGDNKTNEEIFDTKENISDDLSWPGDNEPADCVEALIDDIKSEHFDTESNEEQTEETDFALEKSLEANLLETNSNSLQANMEEEEVKQKIFKEPEGFKNKEHEKIFKARKTKEKIPKEKLPKIKIPKEKKIREKKPPKEKKEKVPKAKKPKNADGEKINQFVCEQCGAAFQSRPGLVAHLLRHTGEKKFGCEICADVKFFSIYELQRHMRFHTGENPYQCRHCERCFRDYSHRQRHERSKHLNIRPFACATCGKTFTNNYIAKNHMLTHTKLRQFECKICDKFFLRQTHLITHYRSVTHKNNAAKYEKEGETSQNPTEGDGWGAELMLKVLNTQQPTPPKENTDAI